jgi:hypothetical protein
MATLPRTEADPIASTEVKAERERAEGAEALKLDKSAGLSDLADPGKGRLSLGLGTAALEDSEAFDVAGAGLAGRSSGGLEGREDGGFDDRPPGASGRPE